MAGVSRHMARSFVQSARAAGRFCGTKGAAPAAAAGEIGAGARAPRPASFTSPKSFVMESRRPGAFFGRLPGEVAMIQSLLPLHNATASARMVSQLRSSAGALLQDLVVERLAGWAAAQPLYLRSGQSTRLAWKQHLIWRQHV